MSGSPKLYELTDILQDLQTVLEENGGVLEPEMEAALETIHGQFEAKLEGMCKLITNLEAQATALDAQAEPFQQEADRLKAKAKQRLKAVSQISEYIQQCMHRALLKKVKAGTFDISIQKNSVTTVRFTGNPLDIPQECRAFQAPKLDRNAVLSVWHTLEEDERKRLEALGMEVSTGEHLRIR